jgi:hypothetical protein
VWGREAIAPKNAMAGEAGFDLGILKVEVNFENFKKVLDWLGNIFYGCILKFEYEEDGRKVVLNYRTDQEFNAQLAAIERIAAIPKVKIAVTPETTSASMP